MAENGILKIGKASSFQAHQIEHQLGAYTDCNHGQGLAVIHPVLYRKLCQGAPAKFARFAVNVFGVSAAGRTETEVALAGVERLAAFIKEMGLPATFAEMGIAEDTDYRGVADSSNIIMNGCFKPLTIDENTPATRKASYEFYHGRGEFIPAGEPAEINTRSDKASNIKFMNFYPF